MEDHKNCPPDAAAAFVVSQKHAFRSARDFLVDMFPVYLGATYPLPDVLVCAKSTIVSYGDPGVVIVYFAPPDTDYELYDWEKNSAVKVAATRSGNQLTLTTEPLTKESYTFNVFAIKKNSGLRKKVLQTLGFKVGVNVNLKVLLKEDTLPGIEYGNAATIIIKEAQGGFTYQVLDSESRVLSDKIEKGTANDIEIITHPLFEDKEIHIKVSNITIEQEGILKQRIPVRVFPDNLITPRLKDEEINYNESTWITLDKSQVTAQYHLIITAIDDEPATGENINADIAKAPAIAGTGRELILPVPPCKEDTTFKIVVTKPETNLSNEIPTTVFVKVRPDTSRALSLADNVVKEDNAAIIKVALTQKGVRYQLRAYPDINIGAAVYHHKNSGIGKAKIELDFTIDPFNDDSVYLPTGLLQQTTTFNVLATKATTGAWTVLEDTITVEVPPVS